jgi:LysM repeat protein
MRPNKNDFLDDLDNDRDWIHTEVLGQGKRRSGILPIVTFALVLVCFGLLAYIAFRGGLSKQDLSNLDNMDKIKQAQQADDATTQAAKKLAEEQAAAAAAAAADQTVVYTVAPGDTLAAIGDQFSVDFKKIAEANGLAEPYALEVGTQLKIPGAKKPAAVTPETPATTTPAAGETNYTVKSGDTLAGIGIQLGIDYATIAKLNNLQPPYALEVGQVLKIPKKQ